MKEKRLRIYRTWAVCVKAARIPAIGVGVGLFRYKGMLGHPVGLTVFFLIWTFDLFLSNNPRKK